MKRTTKSFIFLMIFFIVVILILFLLKKDDSVDESVHFNSGETMKITDFKNQNTNISNNFNIDINPSVEDEFGVNKPNVFIQTGVDNEPNSETKSVVPILTKLFDGPTAGYRIDKNEDGYWQVKVVEQGKGNRYLINSFPYSFKLTAAGEFTRVIEGHIFSNDQTLLLYEDNINETNIKSVFVPFAPNGIRSTRVFEDNIRVATNNENLFFFIRPDENAVVGLIVDVTKKLDTKIVWESGFKNWLPHWGRNSHITINTPITQYVKGNSFIIDPNDEEPVGKVVDFDGGGGLLLDTSSGFFVLYEIPVNDYIGSTSITDQKKSKNIKLPITLPEKCDGFNGVFVCAIPIKIPLKTNSGYETLFPDSWYQGDISFNDVIVLIDSVGGSKRVLLSPTNPEIAKISGGTKFDVINPRISEDGRFLFFINKKDLSLWMLNLNS